MHPRPTSCFYCGWQDLTSSDLHITHVDISCWHPQSHRAAEDFDPGLPASVTGPHGPPRRPPAPRYSQLSQWPRRVEDVIWDIDPDSAAGIIHRMQSELPVLLKDIEGFASVDQAVLRSLFSIPQKVP